MYHIYSALQARQTQTLSQQFPKTPNNKKNIAVLIFNVEPQGKRQQYVLQVKEELRQSEQYLALENCPLPGN